MFWTKLRYLLGAALLFYLFGAVLCVWNAEAIRDPEEVNDRGNLCSLGDLGSNKGTPVLERRHSVERPGKEDVQNNIDSLWTWSINGAKVAGSLALLTGSIKVIQAVLGYWRDEVLTWWDRFKRRFSRLSSEPESSHKEDGSEGNNHVVEDIKAKKVEQAVWESKRPRLRGYLRD